MKQYVVALTSLSVSSKKIITNIHWSINEIGWWHLINSAGEP